MSRLPFTLVPFPGGGAPSGLALRGEVRRSPGSLELRYRLEGPLQALRIPAPAARPERRDALWEQTCLEFFLADARSEAYREVNLSPAGHWNVYRLTGYRRDLEQDPAVDRLPIGLERTPGRLDLRVEIDPARLLPPDAPLLLAVCAVLAAADGSLSYWALDHPGSRPDFHLREGFRLRP
jgi:hypothetical protein